MKLPTFSLNFFKKPVKKKRTITTFGKRGSSASSSTRKSRRSSSGRKSRKRSITYYAPSKSKFYPTEHFPSLQHATRQATTVATTPLAPRSYPPQEKPVASTDIDAKLNIGYPTSVSGTLRSYTAKQTYLCDNDYGDIILHQPPAWYMQSKPQPKTYQTDQTTTTTGNDLRIVNHEYTPNKCVSNALIDSNGNLVYSDNGPNNNTYTSTYMKECVQGVPIQSMVNAIPYDNPTNIKYNATDLRRQSQHNLLPVNVTTAYNNNGVFSLVNSTNAKCLPNHINSSSKLCAAYQSNAHQLTANVHGTSLPIYSAMVPFKKKSDRHRRRKVRSLHLFIHFFG